MPVRGAGRKKGAERITEEQEQTASDAVAESDGPTITKTSQKRRETGEGLAKT